MGVGKALDKELNEIASDPDSTHVFHVSSFDDISGWVDKISSVSCDGKIILKYNGVFLFGVKESKKGNESYATVSVLCLTLIS